jgi:hypothetical protein
MSLLSIFISRKVDWKPERKSFNCLRRRKNFVQHVRSRRLFSWRQVTRWRHGIYQRSGMERLVICTITLVMLDWNVTDVPHQLVSLTSLRKQLCIIR